MCHFFFTEGNVLMESTALRLQGSRGSFMSAPSFCNNLREDLDRWCSVRRVPGLFGRQDGPLGVTKTAAFPGYRKEKHLVCSCGEKL